MLKMSSREVIEQANTAIEAKNRAKDARSHELADFELRVAELMALASIAQSLASLVDFGIFVNEP